MAVKAVVKQRNLERAPIGFGEPVHHSGTPRVMSAPWLSSFSGARTNMPETLAQEGPAVTTAFDSFAPVASRAIHSMASRLI